MTFEEILDQAVAMLQHRGRMTYRTLKLQFKLDDETLEALKEELLYSQPQIVDDEGKGLIWTGEAETKPDSTSLQPAQPEVTQQDHPTLAEPPLESRSPEAERRQLTVMFCDLVDSTKLSSQLDPEDYRDVVREYQRVCTEVIQRYDGHLAQYLGDGLLVYFGYPQSHEDEAQRAVYTGLGILNTLKQLNARLESDKNIRLALRIGIHTGLVVVGDIGEGSRQEQLALGETPNVAARIQGLAKPDTVVISASTYRLIQGYFEFQELGKQILRGVSQPLLVYQVLQESGVQSRLDVASTRGLTPLVGRESEVTLLLERWQQAKDGQGQVILLSGEAGIGKSRLVQVLKDHVVSEPHTRWECRSSPYYQNTALYPLIDLLQRALQWRQDDTLEEKLAKLEQELRQYRLSLEEAVPLFATLLSIQLPEDRYPSLHWTPRRQRQKTLEAVLAILLELAEQNPILFILEDLHWTDPTTLEFLGLLVEQVPAAAIYTLLTCRPRFQPSWHHRSYLTEITINRLSRDQIERMAQHVAGGKRLPTDIIQQLVDKTDGVPLYVEEMTKALLESGYLKEMDGCYELTGTLSALAIPVTLQDSLMARLDKLMTGKATAQLGATIGRQFSYELLHVVSRLDEPTLRRELSRLVEAELLYQRGLVPQATYTFKHALVQDAAYQSLVRSTKQGYHRRIAEVLVERFPETTENQPELLAHHYTEAGLHAEAVSYGKQAGQRALLRSASQEAVKHLTKGLELLATLPETPARIQQELDLQIALGPALVATKASSAPEVEQTYARAQELCGQIDDTPQIFPALRGLGRFYQGRGALQTARALGERLVRLAQRDATPTLRLEAHEALGSNLFFLGEYVTAWAHLEQVIALIDLAVERALALRQGVAPGVRGLAFAAHTLWCLGYALQAMHQGQEALALAQRLDHPHSLALAQFWVTLLHLRRREVPSVQAQANALLMLATAQGFPLWIGHGTCWQGWALAMQGQGEAGMAQMHQGLAAVLATGQMLARPYCLVPLAEAAGHEGQVDEGLRLLAEALAVIQTSRQGDLLAEAYRLEGELILRQTVPNVTSAEACFHRALSIARHQQAKSWELRAATSLARLWQRRDKRQEAYDLLAPVYNWFTEGFDTADLIDAKALLDELGE